MSTITAITRLRLAGYVRGFYAIAPTLAGLVVIGLLYGGGLAQAGEAYGFSAIVMFPVIAWQTKILLDAEPDVQRRLVRVTAGSARAEISAGLLAALIGAIPTVILALALPWLLGGVKATNLSVALAIGGWTHALAALPAVALGAWSTRVIARTAGIAVCVLAGGTVVAIVLGLGTGPAQWLAPPLAAVARATVAGTPSPARIAMLTVWSLAWTAVVAAGYARLRQSRV
jgi:hypothetical protein